MMRARVIFLLRCVVSMCVVFYYERLRESGASHAPLLCDAGDFMKTTLIKYVIYRSRVRRRCQARAAADGLGFGLGGCKTWLCAVYHRHYESSQSAPFCRMICVENLTVAVCLRPSTPLLLLLLSLSAAAKRTI